LLLLPVFWEFWQSVGAHPLPVAEPHSAGISARAITWLRILRRDVRQPRSWLALLSILLIPLGQGAFMVYGQIHAGSFVANLTGIRSWDRGLTWPWVTIDRQMIQHSALPPSPQAYDPLPMTLLCLLAFTLITIWAFTRLPGIYSFYTLGMVLVPLSSGYASDLPRYYLVVFPGFLLLALVSDPRDHPARFALVVALFAALLTLLTTFFELGLPTSGV
jgi:hypothetical protein